MNVRGVQKGSEEGAVVMRHVGEHGSRSGSSEPMSAQSVSARASLTPFAYLLN